ncbi:MAG: cytochrome P450 [Dehalococcoidia bacterium]|nr:cytochrome P450 [Dehalococcoidia bacterium]
MDNPYPALARLREQEPVHFSPGIPGWVVTAYDLCFRVLHETETFDTDFFPWEYSGRDEERAGREEIFGGAPRLTNSTGADHIRRRGAVAPPFTHRSIEDVRTKIFETAARIVDAVERGEPFDLLETVARPIVDTLLPARLGVEPEQYAEFAEWARAMLIASEPFASEQQMTQGRDARRALSDYLAGFDRESALGHGSAITLALGARDDGTLTADEVNAVMIDIALGDGLIAMIGSTALALAEHPDQWALLRDDPSLVPDAVEELVRWDPSSHTLMRVVTAETVLGEQPLKPGDMLFLMVGAANRDPARFDDPDRLDVTSVPRPHLSFAAGTHFCIGAPFARLTLEAAIDAIVARFERLEVVKDGVERTTTFLTRTLERLEMVAH